MTIREEVMAMAQEANLGRLLPASGDLPAVWYGCDIKALERFAAFVIAAERQRVGQEVAEGCGR